MSASRKKKTLINITTAFLSNILIYFLSLFTSKVIKEKLGLEILGLNGFLTNIVSILNVSELGIGTAITFALYKPLAEDDRETIKSLMAFYKKAYKYGCDNLAQSSRKYSTMGLSLRGNSGNCIEYDYSS